MQKEFNLGIALLKFVASFLVVWIHFAAGNRFTSLAVPCFMILAFYLSMNGIEGGILVWLGKRVYRIIVPFWIWSIICWITFGCLNGTFAIDKLFWQLILGHTVCTPLWFMPVLVAMTIVIFFCFKLPRMYRAFLISMFFVLSYVVQYSGVNYKLFGGLGCHLSWPLGRIAEVLPHAIFGIVIYYANMVKINWITRTFLLIGCVCLIFRAFRLPLIANVSCLNETGGFGYGGLELALSATGVCVLAIIIGEKWRNVVTQSWICSVIKSLGEMSIIIYLSHFLVGRSIKILFNLQSDALLAFATFIVSSVIALLLQRAKVARGWLY